jgi:hypothetical protein
VTVFTGGVQRLTASGAITAGANVEGAAAGAVANNAPSVRTPSVSP